MDALARLFARAGYDAAGLGHNELSLGPEVLPALLAALAKQGLPVVASNLHCEDVRRATCRELREDVLVERAGVRVGVLATMSRAVWAGLPVSSARGLSLADPVQAVRAGVRRLRARGASVVVLLSDGPRDARALDEADELAHHLAEAPPAERPDVVLASGLADLDGHHPVRLLRRDDAPPVFGSSGGVAGFSRVTVLPGQPPVFSVSALAAVGATPDVETAKLLSAAAVRFCARYGTPVAPAPLARPVDRDTFVDYVLQVMRRRAGAEIAVINRPFVKRAAFPLRGKLTRADLYRALPYRAQIGVASLSGAVLDGAFAKAWGKPRLAVVGLARDGGQTKVNGRALDKGRRYRVATIAFVADGGDDLFEPDTLPFRPLAGSADVRDTHRGLPGARHRRRGRRSGRGPEHGLWQARGRSRPDGGDR